MLFVRGAESGSHYKAVGEFLHARFPQLDRQVVAEVGHLLQMEDPARVTEVVSDFIARNPF